MAALLRKCPFFWVGSHLGPAVCIFYFLLRGSRLRKLIKCQRQRDGQEEYQLWGETDLHLNPFSSPTSSGILASFQVSERKTVEESSGFWAERLRVLRLKNKN